MSPPEISFAEHLRLLRRAAGLSQEELAERADLTAAAIGALERGDRRHPYPQTLRALADALDLEDNDRISFFNLVPRRGQKGPDDGAANGAAAAEEAESAAPEDGEAPGKRPASARDLWVVAVAVGVLAAGLGFVAGWLGGPRPRPAAVRPMLWTLPPPGGTSYVTTSGPPALSPDGRHLAFVARPSGGRRQLWLRSLAVAEAQSLASTEGAVFPFWSPDSRRLAFFADGRLRSFDVVSGLTVDVARVDGPQGGTWGPDGTILAASDAGRAVLRISPAGETEKILPGAKPAQEWYFSPWFLPDGRHYFVTVLSVASGRATGIYLASLDRGSARLLLPAVSNIRYTPPGQVVYYNQGALRVQRFDPESGDLLGHPVLLESSIEYSSYDMAAFFAVDEHLLVHLPGGRDTASELAFYDRGGAPLGVLGEAGDYFHPRLSPDGTRLAVDVSGAQQPLGDLWIFDVARGGTLRLTSDPLNESRPIWLADGDVIYVKGPAVYRRSSSGTGEETLVFSAAESVQPLDVSPDARLLLFAKEFTDIWVLDLESGAAAPWLVSPFREHGARFSPDGGWVAYAADDTGRFEIYVQDFPARREKYVVSQGEGRGPVWSHDGRELFFYAPGQGLMSAAVEPGPEFVAEPPRLLFPVEVRSIEGHAFFDVTPDGQRFLVDHLVEQTSDEALVFRTAWESALVAAASVDSGK